MIFKLCSALMSLNYNLETSSSTGEEEAKNFQNTAVPLLQALTTALCVIMSVAVTIWAIWCAIGFFRAKDGEKRDEAKKKLVYSVVAVIVTALLIVILMFVKNNLPKWMGEGEFFPKQ